MRTQDYHLDHSATQLISNHTCFCFQPLKRKKPHFKLSLKVFFLLSNSNEAAKMRRKLFLALRQKQQQRFDEFAAKVRKEAKNAKTIRNKKCATMTIFRFSFFPGNKR